jgi:hypothetical protein
MILHQENLDFDKHCSIAFGTYVQAHQEPLATNTQHPRTLDCIYLRYVDNQQGGHHLLDLRKVKVQMKNKTTMLSMKQDLEELLKHQ